MTCLGCGSALWAPRQTYLRTSTGPDLPDYLSELENGFKLLMGFKQFETNGSSHKVGLWPSGSVVTVTVTATCHRANSAVTKVCMSLAASCINNSLARIKPQ